MSSRPHVVSDRDVDPIERTRVDLAAAFRLSTRFGMHEGVCNHFTVMLPGRDRFLVNPHHRHWSRMRASDLLVIDLDGNVVEGEGRPPRTAHCIHTPIHLAHPTANVVLHTHMPNATALCALAQGELLPVHQNAARFLGRTAYDRDFSGLAFDPSEGERMAAVMGDALALFLTNHGIIMVGETVAEAFDDLYFLERACEIQVLAMSTGQPLALMSDNVAKATAADITNRSRVANLHFDALKEILDDESPDYVN